MHTISLKNRIALALIIALCAFLIIASVIGLRRLTSRSRNYDTTADGLTYLRQLSARDLAEIDATLAEQKRAHEIAERDQRMKELTDGTVDVWSYFTDYVLFGDSRAVGFSYYGFLAESRVLADSGWTIRDLEANLDSIIAMNPSSIYLAFGLNDVGMGYWDTPDDYAEEFKTILEKIKEQLPNASIYVNSILPTTEAAAAAHGEVWTHIPEYSAALEKACRESDCLFINNDELVASHADMFDEDGIHMVRDFYPLWAANMMLNIYGATPSASAEDASEGAAEETFENVGDYTFEDTAENTDTEDANTEDANTEDTYTEDTYSEDTNTDDTYTEDTYSDGTYSDDTYSDETNSDETYSEDTEIEMYYVRD